MDDYNIMSSNYPPGAANDPFAPYNEPEDVEMEVLVEQKLNTGEPSPLCTRLAQFGAIWFQTVPFGSIWFHLVPFVAKAF